MNYKIIDNFLLPEEFNYLKEKMLLTPAIPWSYAPYVTLPDTGNPYDFQFTHTFYRDGSPTSDLIGIMDSILRKLNPSALVRIKANLQTRTDKIHTHEYHYDHEHFDGKIAIFYVNTNNGHTIFKDGTEIESIENRLVIFDGNTFHTGTTCTDQKVRCVINFMFYQWTNSNL
jgi:hypothetical protein